LCTIVGHRAPDILEFLDQTAQNFVGILESPLAKVMRFDLGLAKNLPGTGFGLANTLPGIKDGFRRTRSARGLVRWPPVIQHPIRLPKILGQSVVQLVDQGPERLFVDQNVPRPRHPSALPHQLLEPF